MTYQDADELQRRLDAVQRQRDDLERENAALRGKVLDKCEELAEKIFDEKLAARITELEAVLEKWKTWCELNRREGSILYKPTCEVLAKARG